jgi:PAS domain S-box-containing protein
MGAGPRELEQVTVTVAVEELRAQRDALNEARRELERERAKYAELFDSVPVAYVTTDRRGIITEGNPAAAQLLCVAQAALPGKLLISFVARGDTRAFREHLRGLPPPSGGASFGVKVRPRGRRPFAAVVMVRAIRTPGGSVVAYGWAIRSADP